MLIWSGWGFVVPMMTFGALVATEYGVESLFGDTAYYQANGWTKLAAMVLAAALVFIAGKAIGTRTKQTTIGGKPAIPGVRHTFFFVEVRHWPWVLASLGCVIAVTGG